MKQKCSFSVKKQTLVICFKLENIDYLDLQYQSQQTWDEMLFTWEYFLC